MHYSRLRRHVRGAAFVSAVMLTVAIGGPAEASDTTTTFALTGGSLSISAPSSAAFDPAATGSTTVSGNLGNVTVTDNRGTLLGTWTASASSTDFTTGGATAAETVGKANVAYASGLGTSTGVGVFAGSLVPSMTAGNHTVFTGTGVTGNNSVTWNPTITISLPGSAVAGTYSGTITHSVS